MGRLKKVISCIFYTGINGTVKIFIELESIKNMIQGKRLLLIPRCRFSIAGESLGVLKYSYVRPRATFSGREGDLVFFREKWFNGGYFLMSNFAFIAQAQKPNDMGSKYDVQYHGKIYKLVPGDHFYDSNKLHYVVLSDEQEVGVIAATWREIGIALDSSLPASVQVFMFWLSLTARSSDITS